MGYYKYTGEIFICDWRFTRIQVHVLDLQSNKLYKPVVTIKNKMFNKFCNKDDQGFYFTANNINSYYSHIKNVNIYEKDDFYSKFTEFLI